MNSGGLPGWCSLPLDLLEYGHYKGSFILVSFFFARGSKHHRQLHHLDYYIAEEEL